MTSPDLSSVLGALTPAQQEAIKALIAQEAAKNAPPPPKVLTPAEQADLYLAQARAAFSGENTNFHLGQIVVIDRILSLLENIIKAVYAVVAVTEPTTQPTVPGPVESSGVSASTSVTDGGAV